MAGQHELVEIIVLDAVRRERSMKLERLVSMLPELSWNQIFHCIDLLSRRGDIILMRRGFDYEVTSCKNKARPEECPA